MRRLRAIGYLIGSAIFIIGLAGIPDDVATWRNWLAPAVTYINQDLARWIFAIVGLLIIGCLALFPRISIWCNQLRGNDHPQFQEAEQPSDAIRIIHAAQEISGETISDNDLSENSMRIFDLLQKAAVNNAIWSDRRAVGEQTYVFVSMSEADQYVNNQDGAIRTVRLTPRSGSMFPINRRFWRRPKGPYG